ncbi:DinB family protein [Alicyclobacillus dauci]|uniref:DinB family protein n=1 Tax=Alicyclobacillus dauci TaxID=1475485 RepID=A0ABY6Z177_9BACL|nr:DinB family protein [Alicyclobacillus dauci]WAH36634.1 DinB family protein [Alicyclobacillus dauci]
MPKADSFIQSFLMHRNVLGGVLDNLTDKDLDFHPWDGAFSTADLVWHMLSSTYTFASTAASGAIGERPEKPVFTSIDELKNAAREWTEKTVETIRSMSDEQFNVSIDTTKMIGRDVTAGQLLSIMRDHEIHHKGQLFVYARLCGAQKLPLFIHAG